MMTGHSAKCQDLSTYWDGNKCVRCKFMSGHEVSPNCGRDDDESFHEFPFKPCPSNTFNKGDRANCTHCSSCPSGDILKNCTSTNDTVCQPQSRIKSTTSVTTQPNKVLSTQPQQENFNSASQWAIPLAIFVTGMLLALSAFMINRKRKKGQQKMCYDGEFAFENNLIDPEDPLNVSMHSAPLQTVLDNLDVLEELVILLDPEIQGKKNTKHLASFCSFPSTWITYAYSMKESKSPLKAVLEGVTSKYPDWTVGHLAKLLRKIERNDAIAVLAKLRPSPHIYG